MSQLNISWLFYLRYNMIKEKITDITQLNDILNNAQCNQQFCQSIYNSPTPCLGVKIGVLRQIVKQIELTFALSLPQNTYIEYDIIKGLAIVKAKISTADKQKLLTQFSMTIDSWATCDTCILSLKSNQLQEYWQYFCDQTKSDLPFVVRFGIVNLRRNYLCSEYLPEVIKLLQNITYGHYYIDMAVAWLVADIAVVSWDSVVQIIANKILPAQVVKMALQKIRDSKRITSDKKQWTHFVNYCR